MTQAHLAIRKKNVGQEQGSQTTKKHNLPGQVGCRNNFDNKSKMYGMIQCVESIEI